MSNPHIALLHALPCVVCKHMGIQQLTRTIAHHIESVRDEDSDYAAVAICQEHHQGSGFGIHDLSRSGFTMRYKLTEIDLMSLTIKELYAQGMIA